MRKILFVFLLLASVAWGANSTTYIVFPNRPLSGQNNSFVAGNPPSCNTWVPEVGITNATTVAFYIGSPAAAGVVCGVAIYDSLTGTQVAAVGSIPCDTSGAKVATGITPFTLTAGQAYDVCLCSTGGSNPSFLSGNQLGSAWVNVLSVATSFTATNSCDGTGNPPLTIGVKNAANRHLTILWIATNAP